MHTDLELCDMIRRLQDEDFPTEADRDAALHVLDEAMPEAVALIYHPGDEVPRSAEEVLKQARLNKRVIVSGADGLAITHPHRQKS